LSAELALDAALWSVLDAADPVAEHPQTLQTFARGGALTRFAEMCFDHVLFREVLEEEAARAEEEAARSAKTAGQAGAKAGPTDAELVLQAETGTSGAFDVLVERYFSMVTGVAYSLISDADAARDVAQESFFEAARTLPLLRDRNKFANWLYGIARRKAIYILRRRRMHKTAIEFRKDEENAAAPQEEPGAPMARNERSGEIRRALEQLPEIYREILVLKYMDSRSYEEIAALLGISLAAVDKRLTRGKAMLRESLRRWMDE